MVLMDMADLEEEAQITDIAVMQEELEDIQAEVHHMTVVNKVAEAVLTSKERLMENRLMPSLAVTQLFLLNHPQMETDTSF